MARIALASSATLGLSAFASKRRADAQRERAAEVTRQIAASERRWRGLVQNSWTAVVHLDINAKVLFVSDTMERMLGHPLDSYVGNTLKWITHTNDWPVVNAAIAEMLITNPGGSINIECRAIDADITTHILGVTATDMRAVEDVGGVVLNVNDLTEKRMLESRVHHIANKDPLTLLPNRTAFIDEVDSVLRRSSVNEESVSVAVINVDDFRLINEGYGTETGDQVLVELALRLRRTVSAEDTVARLSGDEFGILFSSDSAIADTERLLSDILTALQQPVHVDENTISTQSTAGYVIDHDGISTAAAMIRRASTALDTAKAKDRGSVIIFDDAMGAEVSERAEVRDLLRDALTNGELRMVYQPIVEMHTGHIVGLEALARWTHPKLGPISPGVFIPIAESSNLIFELGEWALRTACAQIRTWEKQGLDGFVVSVNMSGKQLLQHDIIDCIKGVIADAEISPERLTIEITESVLIDETEVVSERICEIRRLGVRLSIDDFGTGYSSLSYLRRYEFDVLKIDRSFVIPLGNEFDRRDRSIVKNMITLAQDLGAVTVAEGIENDSELKALQTLGCDRAQGYLFWKPLEVADAESTLLSCLPEQDTRAA